ncbi:MAG: MBL fold metallo-hydrolase [Armatimonadota bacterium]|nr:MBL fold metallo-hydrolase [Armatimonadota bacterium]
MDPSKLLVSFSLALYSQWFYHKPTRCLFDAGECVATALGKRVFGIRRVFLSHGHEDHISGLANLVNVRNLAAGSSDKPLHVYYPFGDPWIEALLEYIKAKQSGLLRYALYAEPIRPGDQILLDDLKRPTRVTAFETAHVPGRLCLGFEIEQEKTLLDLHIGHRMRVPVPVFFYSGDGYQAFHSPYGRVELAIHEATFLQRDVGTSARHIAQRHSTVETAIQWATREDVKCLILCHISDRYSKEELLEAARAAIHESKFRGEAYAAIRDAIIPIAYKENS